MGVQMRHRTEAALLGLSAAAMAFPVIAQDAWQFNITPYGWMAGIDGDLGTVPGLPSQEVSLSFGDILDDLDYGLFLFASARKGPWVLYFDASDVKTTSKQNVGGPTVENLTVESRTSNMAIAAGRTIAEADRYTVDAYFGARAWWLDNEFTVTTRPDTGLGTLRESSDASWVDPLVGLAGRYALNEKWTLFASGDVGGFGAGADLEWSLQGGATWMVNDGFGVTGAWRLLSVDYDRDGIVFDVTQSGPLLGLTFRF